MNKLQTIRIPVLSFRASGIMAYEVPADLRERQLNSTAFQSNSLQLQKRQRYIGYVTDGVKKRMKKCITILLQSTPWQYKTNPVTGKTIAHKLSFITLTTPTHENSYDAKWCHKNLLEPTLRILRKSHSLKSYIWKVELQSNGQVHYHITCDIIINHTTLRDIWNNLLRKHDMLEDFKVRYGHDNPNSTDIHKVYNVRNLEAYLVKYICKEYQNETKINAKIWDASMNIKTADYFKIELDFELHQFIRQMQNQVTVITHYFEKAIYLDFKTSDYYSYFNNNIVSQFFTYLQNIQSWQQHLNTMKTTCERILHTITEDLNQHRQKCKKKFSQLTLNFYARSMQSFKMDSSNYEMSN